MHQNVDYAAAKFTETRRRFHREIDEYMCSWDQAFGRPHYIKDKVWQMMHSNDTKTMNLDKDFEGPMARRNKLGGMDRLKKKKQGSRQKKNKTTARNRDYLCSTPADGKHGDPGGRVFLLWVDDGAVGVSVLIFCLREGVAVQGHSERH